VLSVRENTITEQSIARRYFAESGVLVDHQKTVSRLDEGLS
jgi:hypothetical protein